MTPCKFQLDATGQGVLVYSRDRKKVHAQTFNPSLVSRIVKLYGLTPLSKCYALARVNPDGELFLGAKLKTQTW